jgi:DNA invertase Pin-like site-specific DNA recombinase
MSHESPKPKRAAAYARRSSKHLQSSIARQMSVIRKHAKRRGLKIAMNYSDGAKGGGKA